MAHVRQQIRDRIATILTGLPSTGNNVYKMRRYALDDSKLPAILVYTMDESSSLITIGSRTITRTINISVEILALGSSATIQDTIDTLCVNVEEAVGNDYQLNGLAKSCILASTEVDIVTDGEKPISSARLVFACEYITAINDVETAR
jgi:hypothetical protein